LNFIFKMASSVRDSTNLMETGAKIMN